MQRTLLAALITGALLGAPAWAAINPNALGAAYDATKANVTFKVYSSKATRIELYLYSTATGTAEKAKYVMTNTSGIWSVTIPTSTLGTQG
jgi:isoamylase